MSRGEDDAVHEIIVVPSTEIVVTPVEETEPELLPSRFTQRLRASSEQETEAAYVAARTAWAKAMKAASSGRPADLASLAIAQEAYEAAVAERERWIRAFPSSRRAFSIDAPNSRELDVVVDQEITWRHVNDPKPRRGFKRVIRGILRD